jgi:hypothetical protein
METDLFYLFLTIVVADHMRYTLKQIRKNT